MKHELICERLRHRCSSRLVWHRADRLLRCHYCGDAIPVPKRCPTCGNQDLQAFGRGTQRLEISLGERFPEARVARIDRDSVKTKRAFEAAMNAVHAGTADILVGTQMLSKGHDFARITLVIVVGADAALLAPDYRATERLYAGLMQVAGRAGRAELAGEVLIQTRYPDHPLYRAVQRHDYCAFAQSLLTERRAAGFPPFVQQAVLRADAEKLPQALEFLRHAKDSARSWINDQVTVYDPVPLTMTRVAGRERAQLLVQAHNRRHLQEFLGRWAERLYAIETRVVRWHLDVDPLDV